jgi:hypothetical protein
MAEKQVNLASGLGTPAYEKYQAAQQNLERMLAERENRLFDPTLLAMAQGFLAPTKTGSFGESLGNVAGAVAPVQQAEDKRAVDLARMRLEVAQQGVQTGIQTRKAQQNSEAMKRLFGETPAAQPAPQPGPQPAPQPAPQPTPAVAGGLPAAPVQEPVAQSTSPLAQAAPALAPAPAPAPAPAAPLSQPVAQQAPQQPKGSQLFPAMPENLTAQEKAMAASMFSNNKEPYEIIEKIEDLRRKNLVVNERGVTNIKTGEVFSPVDPTPTDVRLPDGTTHITTKTMASRLAGAQASGNAEEYFRIVDQIQKGMTRPTPVGAQAAPAAAPATAPAVAPVGRPRTKEEEEASAAQTKAEATKRGEGREGRTSAALDAVKAAEDTRIIAQSAKDVINQPNSELFMGVFEKPKIKTALAKMVEDTVFAPTNFREAVTSLNIALSVPRNPNENNKDYMERKQEVMDRYIEATTLMAQAKFAASLLSKGQGTITDGERKLFADTTINTKMSVNAFNKISDMLIERSKFAEDLGGRLAQNKMQIDDFKQTPEYKKMAREYEGRLSSILRSGRPGASSNKPSSSGGRPDLNAAGANLQRQGF